MIKYENMKIRFIFTLCSVLFWSYEVHSEVENEIKRGIYPFLAVIYFSDEAVVDSSGTRFQRAAVLIKPDWLLSSSIDHTVVDGAPVGFPTKTLLAKAGAISLDSNFTLNEDEDEQEREIIQLVRPTIHNPESWWFTDITLLKTLLPFKETSAVAHRAVTTKPPASEKCVILVFAKKYNKGSEDKTIHQLTVDLLPATVENCGSQFSDSTMSCAFDTDETKNAVYDPEFCQGNSGGPLLCDSEIVGLQTYIENNCKQPHLYQLLASWENFITCGTAEKCSESQCNVCAPVLKDKQGIEEAGDRTESTEAKNVDTTIASDHVTEGSESPTDETESSNPTTSDSEHSVADAVSTVEQSETTTTAKYATETHEPTESPDATEPPETTEAAETDQPESPTESPIESRTETTANKMSATSKKKLIAKTSKSSDQPRKSWPNERAQGDLKKNEQTDQKVRNMKMEAQMQPIKSVTRRTSSSGKRLKISKVQNVLIALLGLACLF